MSARFGRNQRRAMHEKIAKAENTIAEIDRAKARADSEAAAQRNRADELARRPTSWAEDIAHLMGRESAFNEQVARMEVRDLRSYGGTLRLAPVRLPTYRGAPDYAVSSVETIITAAIYTLRSDVVRDRLSHQVRLVLESRNGDVGFAMNAERHRNWSPRDIDYLSGKIARETAQHLALDDTRRSA